MNGGPISWKSRRQDNASVSTSEAKFVAASLAGQEAIHLRETLTDFGFSQTKATLLYGDNLACVAMRGKSGAPKVLPLYWHKYYVRELVLNGFLKLVPSRTHKMVADALTKLAVPGFRRAPPDNDWSCFFRRSTPTLCRRLILSAEFERCVLPYFFRLIVYFFSSPFTLRPGVLSCVWLFLSPLLCL